MDKPQRKAALKGWKQSEEAALLAAMPLSPEQLHRLLDHLDAHLTACDHTTQLTAKFLQAEQLDGRLVLAWLGEQGGYCDCEVLANLADLDEPLQAPATVPQRERKPQPPRVARSLANAAGWNLSLLAAPWRVANLYAPAEPLRLELGKKGGCTLTIVESPLPARDQASDDYWAELWHARTELQLRGDLQVNREVLELPAGLNSTLVRSPGWTPVYCWITPDAGGWYVEVCTELGRVEGDLVLVGTFISQRANSRK
jgi:hypothetical protein